MACSNPRQDQFSRSIFGAYHVIAACLTEFHNYKFIKACVYRFLSVCFLPSVAFGVFFNRYNFKKKKKKKKLALFMKRIINFQQMIRCKEVLLRKDWRIINLIRVAGLQEEGPGYG